MSNTEIEQQQKQPSDSNVHLRCYADDTTDDAPVSYPIRSVLSRTEQLEQLLQSLNETTFAPQIPARRYSESNNRQYARLPAPQVSAILTLNGRSYDCQLVEMSLGGFGVVIPGTPKLKPGSEGKLRAPGLNYIVSMTRHEVRAGGTYVGLQQIEELIDQNAYSSGAPQPLVGYLIAGVAGALVATLMYFFKFGG